MSRYLLSPEAREDLLEIRDYISKDNPEAARRVIVRLRDAATKLADTPRLGHVREDLADEALRFWSVYSYLIVYRPKTRPLEIVRILHGARNVAEILTP